jgi:hypothetical protein
MGDALVSGAGLRSDCSHDKEKKMVRRAKSAAASALSLMGLLVGLFAMVSQAATPPNDDIGTATPITALPFSESSDTTQATVAADDPQLFREIGDGVVRLHSGLGHVDRSEYVWQQL